MRKKMMYPFVILELLLFFMAMLTNITDIGIKSYTSAAFDVFTLITNIIAIIQIKSKNNNKEQIN